VKLLWLRRAVADRNAQIDYIAQESPSAAIDQGDRVDHQVSRLIDHPDMGRPGRVKGTRELVIGRTPCIVVSRVNPKAKRIELLRMLHGSQQWPPSSPLKAP